ncbi:hypothetical protein [Mesorhizobium sp. GbtcB19]|uniref:hypothetical protein n=1 Tax=Mesorhizobium sp. GbtcB19 TaxID=2824764 RepID=UPI001C2F501C|nr:hypothetical protein [Mesorhizobium sp. GbtcB19]
MVSFPVVSDITSALAVESAFQDENAPDPFAFPLAGILADSFIFGEKISYIMPVGNSNPTVPPLLSALKGRDPDAIQIDQVPLGSVPIPTKGFDFKTNARLAFKWMARVPADGQVQNIVLVNDWLRFQRAEASKRSHNGRLNTSEALLYDMIKDAAADEVKRYAARVGLSEDDFIYFLDNVIRGLGYFESNTEEADTIFYPLRVSASQEYVTHAPVSKQDAPLRVFGAGIQIKCRESRLSLDDYTYLLHELRGLAIANNWRGLSDKERSASIDEAMHRHKFPMQLNPILKQKIGGSSTRGIQLTATGVAGYALGTMIDPTSLMLKLTSPLAGMGAGELAVLAASQISVDLANFSARALNPAIQKLPDAIKSPVKNTLRKARILTFKK